jgi:D-3-phosphoglycerate dehydrogenase
MMHQVLLAADEFLTPKVLAAALEEAIPGTPSRTIATDWPETPFHDYAGVHEAHGNEDQLIAALQGCDVCFSHTWPISEKVLSACPGLAMVTICRGGPVNVDIDAATRHGVVVSFTPGRNAVATAEHTVGMIMDAARQICHRDREIRRGQWPSDAYRYDRVGIEISGSTAGVVGYGAVGSRVARILAAMGARVLVFDPWAKPETLPEGVVFVDSLEKVVTSSHILTLHARANADNRHLIDRAAIAAMPEGAILVNCARGQLVDYGAVVEALDSGHLFAAAFDCFDAEPLPADAPIRACENATMTPHLGGASRQAAERAARIGAADIAAFLGGGAPLHCANPEVLSHATNER